MSENQATAQHTSGASTLAPSHPVAPALDAKVMELLELFTYTQQKINDHLEKAFAADNLSLAHYRALFFILRYPGISVSALIDKLNITKQSLARVLSDLIRGHGIAGGGEPLLSDEQMNSSNTLSGGYVFARVDENDRRARQLFLTAKGNNLMAGALTPVAEAMRRSFGTAFMADESHSFVKKDS